VESLVLVWDCLLSVFGKGILRVMVMVTVGALRTVVQYKGLYDTLDITLYSANAMLSDPFPTPFLQKTVPSMHFYCNPSSPYSMSISSLGSFGSWDS